MKRILKSVAAVVIVAVLAFASFADTVPISATIDPISTLDITVSRVDGTGTFNPAGNVAFGILTLETDNSIFVTEDFYVVDIGVIDNTGTWTLTHTVSSITNGTDNLDTNINVTVVEQLTSTTNSPLDAVSYANSNGLSYTQASIASTSSIRISYGVGTGSGDNPGVVPIDSSTSTGSYSGTITLTLT